MYVYTHTTGKVVVRLTSIAVSSTSVFHSRSAEKIIRLAASLNAAFPPDLPAKSTFSLSVSILVSLSAALLSDLPAKVGYIPSESEFMAASLSAALPPDLQAKAESIPSESELMASSLAAALCWRLSSAIVFCARCQQAKSNQIKCWFTRQRGV